MSDRPVRFARRTSWNRAANPLATLLAEARQRGQSLIDLTVSNPTACGLAGDAAILLKLGDHQGAEYAPDPLGLPSARGAVVGYYRDRSVELDASHVVLSASTSEAYGWLFKLLTDRDDVVLVPRPSYPLFEYLAALEDVRLVPYPLMADERWRIDVDAIRRAIDSRTRAILVVHPNNPTGSMVRTDELAALDAIADEHGLALIVDEVFGDYVSDEAGPSRRHRRIATFAGERRALTFVLSGLSKVCALPQVKLAWTAVFGPPALAGEALARLEIIADTYLSVSTPVQLALPSFLAARHDIQRRIRARIAANLASLDLSLASDGAVRRLPVDAGWYATLEVPRTRDEDEWVETLVRKDGIVVHPGWFFDFDRAGYLVVGLLPPEEEFSAAISRAVARLGQ